MAHYHRRQSMFLLILLLGLLIAFLLAWGISPAAAQATSTPIAGGGDAILDCVSLAPGTSGTCPADGQTLDIDFIASSSTAQINLAVKCEPGGTCANGNYEVYYDLTCTYSGTDAAKRNWYSSFQSINALESADTYTFEIEHKHTGKRIIAYSGSPAAFNFAATVYAQNTGFPNLISQNGGSVDCVGEVSMQIIETCIDNYGTLTGIGDYTVAGNNSTGNTHTVTANSTIKLKVDGGSWNDGVNTRYDLAISLNGGSTWQGMSSAAVCSDGNTSGPSAIINVGAATSIKVRANDVNFGDNSGTVSYSVDYVSDTQLVCKDTNLINTGFEYPGQAWIPYGGESGNIKYFQSNIVDQIIYGSVGCGQAAVMIGEKDTLLGTYTGSNVAQAINWPGCPTMYYAFKVRGDGVYQIRLIPLYGGTVIDLLTSAVPASSSTWTTVNGSYAGIPAGMYYMTVEIVSGWITVDQFNISSQGYPNADCNQSPTATPTTTAGPTMTPSPSPTMTATPGGTPGPNVIANCGFNQGFNNWAIQWASYDVPHIGKKSEEESNYWAVLTDTYYPGAPIGLSTYHGALAQAFYWNGGEIFLRFDSMAHKLNNLGDLGDYIGTKDIKDGVISIPPSNSIPAGYYVIHFSWNLDGSLHYRLYEYYTQATLLEDDVTLSKGWFDNVVISSGNYGTCTPGDQITPTPPPTNTPGPSPTWAPSATPTRTSTPNPSWTPQPTYTPRPSSTPLPSSTMLPSSTPLPTDTMTAPELTATAQGTDQPTYTPNATYTPYATYTPQATYTPAVTEWYDIEPPKQQPITACDVNCLRPQDAWELAGWLEYGRCEAFKNLALCPYHVATVVAVPTLISGKEPFNTIDQVNTARKTVEAQINAYDWQNTGLDGSTDEVNSETLGDYNAESDPTSPYWTGGEIDIYPVGQGTTYSYAQACVTALEPKVGDRLAVPLCFGANVVRGLGLQPWFQWFANITSTIALLIYLQKQVIKPLMT